MTKLKWGMIGGGEGSQIGPAHRLGAQADGLFELSAGALITVLMQAAPMPKSWVSPQIGPMAIGRKCWQAKRTRRPGGSGHCCHAKRHSL